MGPNQAYFLYKLRESTLAQNPYMSPLCATDDILRQFPATFLIVSFSLHENVYRISVFVFFLY